MAIAKTANKAGQSTRISNRSNREPRSNRQRRSLADAAGFDIDDFSRDKVVAVVRDVFGDWTDVPRDHAIKLVFNGLQNEGLAARRLGSNIRNVIGGHLTAAVRRGVTFRESGVYNLDCKTIADYQKDDLIKYVCAAIGRTWHSRVEATQATARHLGFRRTGKRIREQIASAIKSGLRKKKIERDGPQMIRKAT